VTGTRRPVLALGTVQLGLPYGIANRTGQPSRPEAVAIIRRAIEQGVEILDTARAYGEAEDVVGEALSKLGAERVSVVSKLAPIGEETELSWAEARTRAASSLEQSRRALRRDRIEWFLLHRATHRTAWGGAVWEDLLRARQAGLIGALGVSVQSPAELQQILAEGGDVELVQLPLNLLDHRWDGLLREVRLRGHPAIHTRSPYLQGLLLLPDERDWPRVVGIDPTAILKHMLEAMTSCGLEGRDELCLAYLRRRDDIDAVVVGVESMEQLRRNLDLWTRAPLDASVAAALRARFTNLPEVLLNPARWPCEAGG